MGRLRYNGLATGSSGSRVALTLGGSLTNSATSVTFSAALTYNGGTAVPTLSGSDYIPLSILDANGLVAEIVHLTAYTSAGTSGTIARGREGTTGVAHASGAPVEHAPSVVDFEGGGYDEPPASANAMDDEFGGSSLDGKWSWINQSTSTATVANGTLSLLLSSTSDQLQGVAQACPGGNWKMRAKCYMPLLGSQYRTAGIVVMLTNTSGAYRVGGPGDRSACVNSGTSPTGTSTAQVYLGPAASVVYVEAEWNGTTVVWREALTPDATFEDVHTWTPGATPAYVGLAGGTYQQTSTLKPLRTFGWFRRVA